ncbi:hypothetical protein HNR60_001834 [Rhodopseudomonas rhenobacensis]|uniref:Uncharacterized protein n=1 Tax=Rhodopseudomonas rhenobacensis TaxID=87461 RepID=A0A7W7Z3P6_9BRAD|nr:hypothetical protein [Rhodopseudomonas rhenobacensis]MBB5047082.1 hypothetical protein [Rhodopseudomonas rhenobacensis]
MQRSPGTAGFKSPRALSPSRLTHAVVAALAFSSLSLCLIVAITVLSTGITMAQPL